MNVPVRQPGKGTGTGGPPPSPPSRQAAANPPANPVWQRVHGHTETMQAKADLFITDPIKLAHLRMFVVAVGTALDRDEPVDRDDLERLAGAAVHWAQQLPDPEPKEPTE